MLLTGKRKSCFEKKRVTVFGVGELINMHSYPEEEAVTNTATKVMMQGDGETCK